MSFRQENERCIQKRIIFNSSRQRNDPQYRQYPRERIRRLLTGYKFADLSLYSDDYNSRILVWTGRIRTYQSYNKICTGKVKSCKTR